MDLNPNQHVIPRSFQFALFLAGCLWLLAAESAATHTAQVAANAFNSNLIAAPLNQALLLLLLLIGFTALNWIATRTGSLRSTCALPRRRTSRQEFLSGAAIGWGLLVAVVLPMMLTGTLHPDFAFNSRSWLVVLTSIATLGFGTLAVEIAFRGFLFGRLISAIGPTAATLLLSLAFAITSSYSPSFTPVSVAANFLLGALLSLAYLRTHGVWLGWGFRFALHAAMGILFGLPVAGYDIYSSLISTDTSGPDWLSGGLYGPEASFLMPLVVCVAMAVVYRITRDYAWNYTHPEILPAGVPVTIAPSKAHIDMESTSARTAPLIQILATTSTQPSTMPAIEEHLRRETPPESFD